MKYAEHSSTQQLTGTSNKGSFSIEPMCKIFVNIYKNFIHFYIV